MNQAALSQKKYGSRPLGIFVVVESLLIWVPLIVLGAAIEWPASLSEPASVILPQILEKAPAVTVGYFGYLLYSLLFFPMAWLLVAHLERDGFWTALGGIAVGFAALSTLARSIGIVRWLTAMPLLAEAWAVSPGRDIEIAYDTLNALAGGIGEIVGVGIFAGVWAIAVGVLIVRSGGLPAWTGWFGIASGVSVMAPVVELFGMEIGGLITFTTSSIHIWWLVIGGYLIAYGREPSVASNP